MESESAPRVSVTGFIHDVIDVLVITQTVLVYLVAFLFYFRIHTVSEEPLYGTAFVVVPQAEPCDKGKRANTTELACFLIYRVAVGVKSPLSLACERSRSLRRIPHSLHLFIFLFSSPSDCVSLPSRIEFRSTVRAQRLGAAAPKFRVSDAPRADDCPPNRVGETQRQLLALLRGWALSLRHCLQIPSVLAQTTPKTPTFFSFTP